MVIFVEFAARIFHGRRRVFLAVKRLRAVLWETKQSLPNCRLFDSVHILVRVQIPLILEVRELASEQPCWTIHTPMENPFRNRLGRSHSCVLWALLQHHVSCKTHITTYRPASPAVRVDWSFLVDWTGSSARSSRLQPQPQVRRAMLWRK